MGNKLVDSYQEMCIKGRFKVFQINICSFVISKFEKYWTRDCVIESFLPLCHVDTISDLFKTVTNLCSCTNVYPA